MRRRFKKSDFVVAVAIAILMLLFLYLASIWMNYRKSNEEYAAIKDLAVTEDEEEDIFYLDWDYLHALNPDIIAWIRFPGLDISYPIVQGENNEEYLHTTVDGMYAYAGSIFLDAACSPLLDDDNSIIHGHNMRNRSMFGSLKLLYQDKEVLRENEYFWIYTEDYIYTYSIFALGFAEIEDTNFGFVNGTKAMKQAYINFCIDHNMFDMPAEAGTDDFLVTLSTCASDGNDENRFQVHAVRTGCEDADWEQKNNQFSVRKWETVVKKGNNLLGKRRNG